MENEVYISFVNLCEKYDITFERGIEILKSYVHEEEKKKQIQLVLSRLN